MAKLAGVPAGSEVDPCCCDCCLYPWPDPDGVAGGPFYPATDLPDTVEVSFPPTFTENPGPSGIYTRSDYYYLGPWEYPTYSPPFQWQIRPFVESMILGVNDWVIGKNVSEQLEPTYSEEHFFEYISFPCLVIETLIEAENTEGEIEALPLYVSDDFSDILTVSGDTITRADLWTCTWTGPKTGGGTWTLSYGATPYKWHLKSTGPTPTSDDKTAPHSSPAGTYGGVTVSGGP